MQEKDSVAFKRDSFFTLFLRASATTGSMRFTQVLFTTGS